MNIKFKLASAGLSIILITYFAFFPLQDQRFSFLTVSIILGCSVFLSSLLKLVPLAAMFGVFLYMGVTSIDGIQMFNRFFLFFKPVKHHPPVSYVRKVSLELDISLQKLQTIKNMADFLKKIIIPGQNMENACVYFYSTDWPSYFIHS